MWIVRLALRRPYTVAVFCFVVLLLGALSTTRMQKDIFPAIDIPVVIVVWNYPGLSAEDMERRVVLISERAYSTTVNGISRIESQSIDGIGTLKVYFEQGTDIGGAIAQISAVSSAATRVMPPGMTPPAIIQFNASNVPVAQMTISSGTRTEQELFDYGLNFVRIRLFTIPGLATPAPYGGKQREVVIDVDPKRASSYGLGTRDVVQALLASNLIEPAGSIRVGSVEYDVTMNSSPATIDEFAQMPLKVQGGAEVRVGDVAVVHDGFAPQTNIARVNGNRATYLAVLKKSNASTLAVVDAARDALPVIRAAAPEGMEIKIDFDQSVFVRAAISGVLREAVISSLLVSAMILVFLGSWRSVIVVSTSIPLSIFVALLGLFATGQSLNIMTLGGMALAIGMLVDDATVEIENIHRNRALGKPLTVAILDGASQIAVPALAATLTICIVFFPVVMLTGPAKYLFTPLALSVVFAMLASYLLSRTLVPTLARMLMEHEHHGPPRGLGAVREAGFGALQRGYERALEVVLAHRAFVMGCGVAIVAVVGLLATVIGMDFFPDVDAGLMRLHVRAPAGTRVEDTEHVITAVEDRIRSVIPPAELETINDNIGVPISYNLAFVQTDNIGGADADVLVALAPGHGPTAEYRRRLREELPRAFPDVQFYFQAADIVSQVLNFGLSAPIDVEVEGANLETSAVFARRLRDRMRAIPGAEDVRIAQVLDRPALRVDVDCDRAAQVGVTQHDVADNVLTTLSSSSLVAPSFWLNPKNNVNYFVVVQSPLAKVANVDDSHGHAHRSDGRHGGGRGALPPQRRVDQAVAGLRRGQPRQRAEGARRPVQRLRTRPRKRVARHPAGDECHRADPPEGHADASAGAEREHADVLREPGVRSAPGQRARLPAARRALPVVARPVHHHLRGARSARGGRGDAGRDAHDSQRRVAHGRDHGDRRGRVEQHLAGELRERGAGGRARHGSDRGGPSGGQDAAAAGADDGPRDDPRDASDGAGIR